MFFLNSVIILLGLFNVVYTKNIIFHINEIKCIKIDHPYVKYYGNPCILWRNNMIKYSNNIYCTLAENSFGELISGCSPAFGNKDSDIIVNYIMNNNSCSEKSCIYTLNAEVSLYNAIHPLYHLIFAIFFIICFVIAYINPPKYRKYNIFYYRGGNLNYNKSTTSWNRIK